MTRGDLVARMPNREFVAWGKYYALKAQREELASKKAQRKRR